jgi:phage shock protein PspC (stress-responsive transcriptional regulator)
MEKIKKSLGLKDTKAGILEYVFGGLAVAFALPPIMIYLILLVCIVRPVKALVKLVWK